MTDKNTTRRVLTIGRDPENHNVTLTLEIEHKGPEYTTTGQLITWGTTADPRQRVSESDRLSICGETRNGGGQMQDSIREDLNKYKALYIPKEKVLRILDIWDAYHLNDMNAGTDRQEAALKNFPRYEVRCYEDRTEGAPRKVVPATSTRFVTREEANKYKATISPERYPYVQDCYDYKDVRAFLEAIPAPPYFIRGKAEDGSFYGIPQPNETESLEEAQARAASFTEASGAQTDITQVGNLLTDRGYKYGSQWLVGALPDEIKTEILNLFTPPANGRRVIRPEDEVSDFLTKNGISFRASNKADRCPLWCDGSCTHGDRYAVTFWRSLGARKLRFSLSFWNSLADVQNGKTGITAHDVISAIQRTDPGDFENFCREFDYEQDSRKAEKTYKAVASEWRKVEKFFTDEELEELQSF